jgi:hypothetical protein
MPMPSVHASSSKGQPTRQIPFCLTPILIHPRQAATSFDCDGCGHHASFHSLENAAEEAILKKWSEQEANSQETTEGATKKRRRIAEKPADEAQVWELTDDDDGAPQSSTRKRTAKKSTVPVTVSAASRARNK